MAITIVGRSMQMQQAGVFIRMEIVHGHGCECLWLWDESACAILMLTLTSNLFHHRPRMRTVQLPEEVDIR